MLFKSVSFVTAIWLVLSLGGSTALATGKDFFVTIGGGYTPEQNQASLEENVLFFQTVLREQHKGPFRHSIFFADGFDAEADLQVLSTANRPSQPLRDLMVGLHRRGPTLGPYSKVVEYRNHRVPDITGSNSPRQIRETLSKISLDAAKGDRLIIYVTAHGGEGSAQDRRNTTITCWNKKSITRDEFVSWLNEMPDDLPVILVMAQCYCGGFADSIFADPKTRDAVTAKPRIGFFAQQHNLPAAGCRPDIEHDQEFSSYFWGTIAGRTRNGEQLTGADLNGDGKISFDEAFANSVIIGDTIDIPLKASDVLLHQFSRIPNYRLVRDRPRRGRASMNESNRSVDRVANDSEQEQTGSEEPQDKKELQSSLSELPCRMQGSLERLLHDATPTSRRIVSELCQQLEIPLTETIEELLVRYDSQQSGQVGGFRGPGRRRSSSGRRELLEAIGTRWPELADPEKWSKSKWLNDGEQMAALKSIQELPEYAVFQERMKQREQQSKDADAAEIRSVRFRRLIDTVENIVLAQNLAAAASPDIVHRHQAMLKLEMATLNGESGS